MGRLSATAYELRPSITTGLGERREQGAIHPLVLVLVVLLVVPESVYLALGSVNLTPMRLCTMLLFPWLLVRGQIRWAWPDCFMLLYFTAVFISYVTTDAARTAEPLGRHFLDAGVPYLVGRYVAQDYARLRRVIRPLVTLLSVLVLTVVFESLFRINVHQRLWSNIAVMPSIYDEERFGLTRAMGWTSHPIMLGLTYVTLLPVAIHAAINRSDLVGRCPRLKAICLGAGVFFSLSSGAHIAGIIVLALFLWEYCSFLPPRVRWSGAFVGLPVIYVSLELLSNRPILRILMMKLHLSSPLAWYYRWMLYERVYRVMPGHWMLGHGLVIPEEFSRVTGWSIDNHYLVLLLMVGRVGLTVWILLMLAVVSYGSKAVWFTDDGAAPRLARAFRLAVFASALAQLSVAVFSTAAVVLWLVMGICVSLPSLCGRQAAVGPREQVVGIQRSGRLCIPV